jgi:hypothetical protein
VPRDQLLRLVPEDVGFCFVLQDLRSYSQKLLASPFAQHFESSSLGRALRAAPELRHVGKADSQLRAFLHVSMAQLCNDIFGDAVVLAYRPGPPDKPEQEQGIMLVHAHDRRLLTQLMDRLNEVQKQSHELKELQTRQLGDAVYHVRVETRGNTYYFLHGSVLAISRQESILRQALERSLNTSEAEPVLLQRLRQCGVANDVAAWWINPRAFDAHIESGAKQASPEQRCFFQAAQVYWHALDGIGVSIAVGERDLELKLALVAQPERLPANLRAAFAGQPKPSDLWQCFPKDALLAMAGRFDAEATMQQLGSFLPPEARAHVHQVLTRSIGAAMGMDIEKDVLPYIGPDWGFCVLAPAPNTPSALPRALTALRVRPNGKTPALEQSLLNGMNALAGLAIFSYNSNHDDAIVLRTVVHDKVELKYLSGGGLPTGVEPAYAFKDGYLLAASSPGLIDQFHAPTTAGSADSSDAPLLRLSLHALGHYLHSHSGVFTARMAEQDHISPAEATKRLGYLVDVCKLFDRLEILERGTPRSLTTVLQLRSHWPLTAGNPSAKP